MGQSSWRDKANPLQEALDKFARIGGTDDHAGDPIAALWRPPHHW